MLSYLTQWATYTNYYGATNYLTNIVLVSVLTTNVAASNALAPVFNLSVGTAGATVEFDSLNYNIARGIMVTNTGTNNLSISVGYLQ